MQQPGNYMNCGWQVAFMPLNQIITAKETEKYVNNNTRVADRDHRVRGDRVSSHICQWTVVKSNAEFCCLQTKRGGRRGDLNIYLLFWYFSVNGELHNKQFSKVLKVDFFFKVFLGHFAQFREVTGNEVGPLWLHGQHLNPQDYHDAPKANIFNHASSIWVHWLVSPPLWSRLNSLNNFKIDCHEVLHTYSWSPGDESSWLWWSPDFSSSTTVSFTFMVSCEIFQHLLDGLPLNLIHTFMSCSEWIIITLLRFHLAASSGQVFQNKIRLRTW